MGGWWFCKIYILDMAGHLLEILEELKECLINLAWQLVEPIANLFL